MRCVTSKERGKNKPAQPLVTETSRCFMCACVTCYSRRAAVGGRRWWWERSCATGRQRGGRGRTRSAACLWSGSGSGSPLSPRCSPVQSNCSGKEVRGQRRPVSPFRVKKMLSSRKPLRLRHCGYEVSELRSRPFPGNKMKWPLE